MTQQEQADNERIAAWLFPKPVFNSNWAIGETSPCGHWYVDRVNDKQPGWVSFYRFHADEAANAILRDAMPRLQILRTSYPPVGWRVWPDYAYDDETVTDRDYKRAIVGAFLKFMEVSK